ncbi:GNAT family N-acetyltransferase [Nocardia amikacinitolerans]|uniref:GNAT family N-acetyltransferase n=1 Tax=Nocardia amikacinitolerans TaxID=756689 RepID=UPI0036CE49F1
MALSTPDVVQRFWDADQPTSAWIATWIDDWTGGLHAHWAVTDADHGRLLGRASVKDKDPVAGQGGLAYWTVPAARGAAVAPRACSALTRWAFDLGFHRLELVHSVHNPASCRVATKTGFTLEGVKRSAGLHLDGWHNMHLHARITTD